MKPFQGFLIEKDGTAKELKYHEIESVDKDNKILWLHFDYTSKEANDWIRNSSNIDSVAVEALLTDETRPRTIVLNDALLIALRGVNLEPNSKPEKMISIRIFISSNVIISTSRKNILSVIEISENLKKGKGVKSSSEFLVELTYRMIDRMDNVIGQNGDMDDWDAMIDINVKGLLYVSKAIIPKMIAKESGHIINIGSIAGKEVYPNGNVYCASKYAVDALNQSMRIDLNPYGIRVGGIHPGMVETEFSEVRFKGDTERAATVYKGLTPLKPEDIADIIHFVVTRPYHVNIADLIVYPTAQASPTIVKRN